MLKKHENKILYNSVKNNYALHLKISFSTAENIYHTLMSKLHYNFFHQHYYSKNK